MKKFKYIILIIIVATISFSCVDDGGTSVRTLEEGIVPNMEKDASTDAFLDLVRIANGENISISFNAAVGLGEPASTNIVAVYRAKSGSVYNAVLYNNVTLPASYTLSVSDIVAAFSELTSSDDFELGDVLTITTSFTRKDGTVLNMVNADGTDNFSSNINNSNIVTTTISYPVSCPSDIGGTYLVSSTGVGCCGVDPIEDFERTVTVTDQGGGAYTLSDSSGGAYYGLFCGPFGICGDYSGTITDVCGTLGASISDCCGSTIEFSGTVNADGTWTVEVSSGFIFAEQTWTKQ